MLTTPIVTLGLDRNGFGNGCRVHGDYIDAVQVASTGPPLAGNSTADGHLAKRSTMLDPRARCRRSFRSSPHGTRSACRERDRRPFRSACRLAAPYRSRWLYGRGWAFPFNVCDIWHHTSLFDQQKLIISANPRNDKETLIKMPYLHMFNICCFWPTVPHKDQYILNKEARSGLPPRNIEHHSPVAAAPYPHVTDFDRRPFGRSSSPPSARSR